MENSKRKHCEMYQVHIQFSYPVILEIYHFDVWFSPIIYVFDSLRLPLSHIKSYPCPSLGCAEDCCQKGVSFSLVCSSPDMTAKISENEIKPDGCPIPKGHRTWFHSRQNTLIHSTSILPRLSKSVAVSVKSGKRERETWRW